MKALVEAHENFNIEGVTISVPPCYPYAFRTDDKFNGVIKNVTINRMSWVDFIKNIIIEFKIRIARG